MKAINYPQVGCGNVYVLPQEPDHIESYPHLSTALCGYALRNPLRNPKVPETLNNWWSFPQSYPQCAQQ